MNSFPVALRIAWWNATSALTDSGALDSAAAISAKARSMAARPVPLARPAASAAASGSIIRRSSKRLRMKAAFGTSPICQPRTSASSRLHSSRGRTTVPCRGADETRPLPARTLIASRIDRREMENCSASRSRLGSVVPGVRCPDTIRRPRVSAAPKGRSEPVLICCQSANASPCVPVFMRRHHRPNEQQRSDE